ncbi:MAG TPA: hypothetical protein VIL37_21265 [Natronosporangium sp.]
METAGALAAGSDRPFRNGWFERQTFWPAVAIVLLVLAVVAIPTWLNHAIAEPTSTVAEGDTATLKTDDDHQVVVEPIPGWERIDSPPDQLQLRNGKATVTVRVAESADNLDRYFRRLIRQLRTSGVQVLPGTPSKTDAGFSGLTGMVVDDGKSGDLSVLANGEAMVTLQSLVPPDQADQLNPQITTMVNSLRVP